MDDRPPPPSSSSSSSSQAQSQPHSASTLPLQVNANAPDLQHTSSVDQRSQESNESSPTVPVDTATNVTQSPTRASADTGAPQPVSVTPSSFEPDAELRRGVGGFSALVGAFMNGFRQAMNAQQEQNASLGAINSSMPSARPSTQSAPATSAQTTDLSVSDANATASHDHQSGLEQTSTDSGDTTTQPSSSTNRTPNAGSGTTGSTSGHADAASTRPSTTPQTLFFRMPFNARNGQSAVLAFTPGPIPVPPESETPAPVYGPERPANLGPERGNGLASGFHLPTSPIFVPHGASPLPFSFLFDTQTNTGWPIAVLSFGPPGAMPTPPPAGDSDTPQFMAGPPFHIALNISFGPPPQPEQPDPERAARFVASLERADAELRTRMARLGMGDIGDYGGRQDNETGAEAALGCGICLDEYAAEDRPEWIGGQSSIDEEVVAVPCAGHHTLHHRCLYEWLANTPPSQWTCPFCRAPLDKSKVDNREPASRTRTGGTIGDDTTSNAKAAATGAPADGLLRTLRDEVRIRERANGWRCDSPACLPRYPAEPPESPTWPTDVISLITLLPCRHKMHVDCLCTSMRLEQADLGAEVDNYDEDEEESEGEGEDEGEESAKEEAGLRHALPVKESAVVGKWVKCPLCRHEAWAELPARRRPKRAPTAAVVGA